jgi:hypothetical protein
VRIRDFIVILLLLNVEFFDRKTVQ